MNGLAHITAPQLGDELPSLVLPPLSRTTCALFAGASGDHNPIHIDIDAANAAGLPDVIGHGMLSMAHLGRLLTRWVPQAALRRIDVRFLDVTRIGDVVTCSGTVIERRELEDETHLLIRIQATDRDGKTKTAGEALVALPARSK